MGVKTKVKSIINLRWDPYLNWIMNNETAESISRVFKNEATGVEYCLYKDICVAYYIILDASVIFKLDSANMPLPIAYTEGNHTLYRITKLDYTKSGTRFSNFTDQITQLLSGILFSQIGYPVTIIEYLQYLYEDLDLGFVSPNCCGIDKNNMISYKYIALANAESWKNNIKSCDVFYRHSKSQEYRLAGRLEFKDAEDASSIHITYFPNSNFHRTTNLKDIDYVKRPDTIREIFESNLIKLELLNTKVHYIFTNPLDGIYGVMGS